MIINEEFEPSNEGGNGDWKARIEPLIPQEISQEKFNELFLAGKILDGRAGGLLVAKVDDEPCRLIFRLGTTYVLCGGIEPGSYLLNKDASLQNRNRVKRMNCGATLREKEVDEPTPNSMGQFLSAGGYPHNRLVLIDLEQDYVYPEPADRHHHELHRLNSSLNPYLKNDLYTLFDPCPGANGQVA